MMVLSLKLFFPLIPRAFKPYTERMERTEKSRQLLFYCQCFPLFRPWFVYLSTAGYDFRDLQCHTQSGRWEQLKTHI